VFASTSFPVHEAASAYIKSQAHAGWTVIQSRYDDGGYSGGSTDRPGLQRLLEDIRARKIDVIVVYKVDRQKSELRPQIRSGPCGQGRQPGTEFLDAETGRQKPQPKCANAPRDQNPGIDWPEMPAETPYLTSCRKRAVCGDWMVGAPGLEPGPAD
jgi:Resolvase, N terminal domain